jgi:NAD(P)-dependent dehydrogenase (short-subunit alcohol dehydrogenase family)
MTAALQGRVTVVTGAASGIGRAVAQAAAAAGATLFLTDRDAAGLAAQAAALPGSASLVADLAEGGAPAAIIAAAANRFGRIDGLVNAAGLTTRASAADGTMAQWDSLFAVNARAPFFLMQGALRDMLARQAPGAIVNILSMNAHCGTPELAIYAASKGALQTLTKNVAQAHMADRIRVNGINLGWTLTEAEHHMQAQVLGKGEGWLAEVAAGRPLGRLLLPEEVARMAVYLLSDASVPLSGAVIDLEQWVAGAP